MKTNIFYIVILAYAAVIFAIFPKWTIDDAFITFRYADNLAHHGALVWNTGSDPVEGYTGIALPLIIAFFIKLGSSPVLISKIIGVISFLLTGFVLYKLMRELGVKNKTLILITAVYFSLPFHYTHALSGLETMLFTLFLTSAFYYIYKCINAANKQTRNEIILFILLLCCALIRPEGALLAITGIPLIYFHKEKAVQSKNGFMLRAVLIFLFPGILYFAWRWNYYGQFLPNTFYVKSKILLINNDNPAKMFAFFLQAGALPVLAAILVAAFFQYTKASYTKIAKQAETLFVIAELFTVLVFAQYLRSSLIMDYSHRFFIPFFPVILFITGYYINNLDESAGRINSRLKKSLSFFVAFLLLAQIGISIYRMPGEIAEYTRYKNLIDDEHIPIGKMLHEIMPPSAMISVHIDAGAIPYYSGLKALDFGGLNDKFLANIKDDEKCVEYFYSKKPDVAVFKSFSYDVFQPSEKSQMITGDPRFGSYKLFRKFGSPDNKDYSEFVFLRNDIFRNLTNRFHPDSY